MFLRLRHKRKTGHQPEERGTEKEPQWKPCEQKLQLQLPMPFPPHSKQTDLNSLPSGQGLWREVGHMDPPPREMGKKGKKFKVDSAFGQKI